MARPAVYRRAGRAAFRWAGPVNIRFAAALAIRLAALLLAVVAGAHTAAAQHELSGRVAVESRWFPQTAAHGGQRAYNAGLVAEPKLYLQVAGSTGFTLAPFFRTDAADPARTHGDLREAYLLLSGPLGGSEWELRLGVDRVFWGVAEARHLVDIVNQTDLVDHPNEKTKLGQPMAHLTFSGDWGAAELFAISYHRLRPFPGRAGRLRPKFRIDNDLATYESGAKEWHLDVAARYSHSFGPLDLGLSLFDGTSREPVMKPVVTGPGEFVLAPHYEQIRQFGLDAQLTVEAWLLKLEAIYRQGARNAVPNPADPLNPGKEEDYAAFVVGGEYTFNGIFESDADLSLLAEWMIDGRRRRATNQYQNDLFLGARLAFNDVQGAEFIAGALLDLDTRTRTLNLEFNRRLTDSVSVKAEAVLLLQVDKADTIVHQTRRDSFIALNLTYSF